MKPALLTLVLFVATTALTGCGSSGSRDGFAHGRKVFAASCSSCHTVTGHSTTADGGDLGRLLLSTRDIESFAAIMPVRPRLSRSDLRAVAIYVHSHR